MGKRRSVRPDTDGLRLMARRISTTTNAIAASAPIAMLSPWDRELGTSFVTNIGPRAREQRRLQWQTRRRAWGDSHVGIDASLPAMDELPSARRRRSRPH